MFSNINDKVTFESNLGSSSADMKIKELIHLTNISWNLNYHRRTWEFVEIKNTSLASLLGGGTCQGADCQGVYTPSQFIKGTFRYSKNIPNPAREITTGGDPRSMRGMGQSVAMKNKLDGGGKQQFCGPNNNSMKCIFIVYWWYSTCCCFKLLI